MFQSGVVSVRTALFVNLAGERSRATSAGRPESLSNWNPGDNGSLGLLILSRSLGQRVSS